MVDSISKRSDVLAVIPARGGSKRIWRKNTRLLLGQPLIFYPIQIARASKYISDIVVTSEDEEILDLVDSKGVITRKRPVELSGDEVTLDPVVNDAVDFVESVKEKQYNIIVTIQPTSPALRPESIDGAIDKLMYESLDSVISAKDDRRLRWRVVDGAPKPLYSKRLNSQWLPQEYAETGGFIVSRREVVTPESRLGEHVGIYPLSLVECVDIDDPIDWLVAEAVLSRLKIAFVIVAGKSVGLGHLYRCLTLVDAFLGHELRIYGLNCDPETLKIAEQYGCSIENYATIEHILSALSVFSPDIVINDILDTEQDYIRALKRRGYFVVNFEDLGPGGDIANLVINALYERSLPPSNHVYGVQYVCLRRDFIITAPPSFRPIPETLIITFGGVDENNLTTRIVRIIPELARATPLRRFLVIVGPGFLYKRALRAELSGLPPEIRKCISVHENVTNMASLVKQADIAITSNGRTVYEIASMGIPLVVISQNDREATHLFSRYSRGVYYLGQASSVSDELISKAIIEIASDKSERMRMREHLLSIDIRGGLRRTREKILVEYQKWRKLAGIILEKPRRWYQVEPEVLCEHISY